MAPGTRLGPYEVTALIGAGGMGEVYRARDTHLKRDVALKVLPAEVATDSDRLARFQREAELLAALNHPHIAQIHGLVEAGGTRALVMELVEGETLAKRIARGPVPLAEALPLAQQVAEALEFAHEHGIIHRDLKPANIKLTPDGAVKVLDFGLAKAFAAEVPSATADDSPTMTSPAMTQAGVILGTAAYMSPEQARGAAVDKRVDIWAFGVVLFETLTGRACFPGETVTDVLAAVVRADPDWASLPAGTPPLVRRLLARCLTKDPRQRLHDVADARLEIDELTTKGLHSEHDTRELYVHAPRWDRWIRARMLALSAMALLVGLAVGRVVWRAPAAAPPVVHSVIDVGPAEDVNTGSVLDMLRGGAQTALTWSPDGRTLAFIGVKGDVRQVYLRDVDRDSARPLDGTNGASNLAFSPDGEWIAFWANRAIRKVRVAGGPSAKLCDAPILYGLAWGSSRLVYAERQGLVEVSSDGGAPRTLVASKGGVASSVASPQPRVASPHLLPGDTAVLYTEHQKYWTSGDERVMVLPLTPGGAPKVLLSEAADARYLPTGHLAFLRQGTLFVVPFDAKTLTLRGGEVAVLKDVAQAVATWSSGDLTVAGQLAVSAGGTLAYVANPTFLFPSSELVTIDRNGHVTPLAAPANSYREHIEPSPDGSRVAVSIQTTKSVRLFLYDLVRGTLTAPVVESDSSEAVLPVWSKGGRIAFRVSEGGSAHLAVFNPDSPSPPEVVSDSADFYPSAWSPDNQRLVGTRAYDLWMYSPNGKDPKFTPVVQTPAIERFPGWSPDGQWLAYASDASGRNEVYVQPYPGPGKTIAVSTHGGWSPAWNPQGKELFYVEPPTAGGQDWRMMTVNMTAPLDPGKPTLLFSFQPTSLPLANCNPTNCYSVAPNGQQFFAQRMLPRKPTPVTHINLILNWFEELKAKVPAKK